MAKTVKVKVPDIGDFKDVEIIDVLVKPGDTIEKEQSLISLESDKATMDIPSPAAGIVGELKIKTGDRVSEGDVILTLETTKPESNTEQPADKNEEQGEKKNKQEPQKKQAAASTDTASQPAAPVHSGADTEILVLGAGPGGYTAAFRAADLGKKVTLVERYPVLGGVCLNVGCIPSKALLHVAGVLSEIDELGTHGIDLGKPRPDPAAIRRFSEDVVGKLNSGLAKMAEQRGVEVVQGSGVFSSPYSITVTHEGKDREISFEQAIIAAGSQAAALPGSVLNKNDPRIMDSTTALQLDPVPERLLVIGGGIIGLEMATIYAALGSSITVVELMNSLMPGTDADLVRPLSKRIGKRYDSIYLKTKVTSVKPETKSIKVQFDGDKAPKEAEFDGILVAIGRRPNGDRIQADRAGVRVDDRGFIPVDDQMRTNVPHIFAIGDINGPPMLAHKATHEGKVAAEVAAGEKSGFEDRVIPSVAYTDPEVAWAGLTETEAKAQGIDYGKGQFPWAASGRALGLGRDDGMTRILFDKETQRVLGVGIVGVHAGDLIAEGVLAIEMGADARDLGLTIHPHPTLSETIGFAAEAFEGTITDLYLPRKNRN
ncbi:MAG: dihydrolipoyl dehydrogenase [Gammaproteobacteria bacterium]|nr:dihydrolipoyl dehydrogenase [Gammaproteobacteria bacterium]